MKAEYEKRLREIEERANAAAEGPWSWEAADPSHLRLGPVSAGIEEKDVLACTRCEGCIESEKVVKEAGKFTRADRAWARCDWPEKSNSDFIAEARADIPWLIKRLREAEGKYKHCRESFADFRAEKGMAADDYE